MTELDEHAQAGAARLRIFSMGIYLVGALGAANVLWGPAGTMLVACLCGFIMKAVEHD